MKLMVARKPKIFVQIGSIPRFHEVKVELSERDCPRMFMRPKAGVIQTDMAFPAVLTVLPNNPATDSLHDVYAGTAYVQHCLFTTKSLEA